ncbi:MAG: hypothetical protein J0H69_01385 [Burkholderiales bacterium]|nr:hypothetical protein [Burkholderiales bacterium]
MPSPLWTFTDAVSPGRAQAMLATRSFADVLEMLELAAVEGFVWEPYNRGSKLFGCARACFRVVVSSATYDALYNCPVGLRATYALSPEHGESANRLALSVVHPVLMAFPRPSTAPADQLVRLSLAAPQAKVWIDEDEIAGQMGVEADQIVFPPWKARTENDAGLRAPCGTRLVVIGGWVDSQGVVRNNPDKGGRSTEIHLTGYT